MKTDRKRKRKGNTTEENTLVIKEPERKVVMTFTDSIPLLGAAEPEPPKSSEPPKLSVPQWKWHSAFFNKKGDFVTKNKKRKESIQPDPRYALSFILNT